jgi:hypothetical protein
MTEDFSNLCLIFPSEKFYNLVYPSPQNITVNYQDVANYKRKCIVSKIYVLFTRWTIRAYPEYCLLCHY